MFSVLSAPVDEIPPSPDPAARRLALDLGLIGILSAVYLVAAHYLNKLIPDELATQTDIVGYPTVFAFNIDKYHYLYYSYSFGLLAVVGAGFLLLRRFLDQLAPPAAVDWPPQAAHGPLVRRLDDYVLPVVLLTAAAIFVFSNRLFGFAYVALALGAGLLVMALSSGDRRGAVTEAVTAVASVAVATIGVGALLLASVQTPGAMPHSVMPPWFSVVLPVAAGLLAAGYAFWHARCSDAQARRTARLRLYEGVAVVALMYLIYFRVVVGYGGADFYHEGEHLVPAALMRQGAFPWRDFLIIHGIFLDGLKTRIGEWLFGGETRWAGQMMHDFMFPLYLSAFYWFFRLAFGGNVLLALVGTLMVAALQPYTDMRAVLYPLCLVLLYGTIAYGTWVWCALFGAVTAFQIALAPEFAFFGVAGGVTIALRDGIEAWHTRAWRAFRRTLRTAAATIVMTTVVAVYLAFHHALVPFIDLIMTVADGHRYVGGIPKQHFDYVNFYANYPLICGVGVLLGALALVRNRQTIPPWYFATIALAIYIILYYPKYLGRADGHLFQVVALATPLLVMASLAAALTAESVLAAAFGVLRTWLPCRGVVMAGIAALLIVLPFPPALPRSAAAELMQAANTLPPRTVVAAPFAPAPRTGFMPIDAPSSAAIDEFRVFFDRHLGATDTVFDMTNASALYHFHLGLKPASRYFHVSLAVRERSQLDVIRDLAAARPKLVVFDGLNFGLPWWDGVHNSVRHYLVSYYLLAHYRPTAVVAGSLILARNEALGLPTLDGKATEDFTESCRWGHHPYFARFATVREAFRTADMDIARRVPRRWRIDLSGWAGLAEGKLSRRRLYVTLDDRVIAEGATGLARPAVAKVLKAEHLAFSGFRIVLDLAEEATDARVRVFAELEDGSVGEVLTGAQSRERSGTTPAAIRLADGRALRVTPGIVGGLFESKTVGTIVTLRVAPTAAQAPLFALQFDVVGRNPRARFEIVDAATQELIVSFGGALAERSTLTVPVGGCFGARSLARRPFDVHIGIADPIPGVDVEPTIGAVRAVELPLAALVAGRQPP